MNVLVTGAAGFIGARTCIKLIQENFNVLGIDNLNDYYDVQLKILRLEEINKITKFKKNNWQFKKGSIEDEKLIYELFEKFRPEVVIHLAAQAGVRYSLENPKSYINSNLLGFFNIIEHCKIFKIKNLIYASSSSVYGGNKKLPYAEIDSVNHPISLYAATKKSNELIAHSYSHLFKIPTTGLRFFTVYGPWGRPDMAPMLFAKAITQGNPIKIFNYGNMIRDFTFIEDVVEGIFRCCKKPATPYLNFDKLNPNPSISDAPFRVFNLGNSNPTNLLIFIEMLEKELGIKAIKEYLPIQPGDVEETASNTKALSDWINFTPQTSLSIGIKEFCKWFKNFYKT
tara:strand:- start:4822 stop:5844 length:1023 start_codon:yes stop_codon:yes gene_type:complete